MNKTTNQLRKGDKVIFTTGIREVKSSVRLSLLSRGKGMSKSYAQTHNEVLWADGGESIFHSNTVLSVLA